jgi:hypothetical protein
MTPDARQDRHAVEVVPGNLLETDDLVGRTPHRVERNAHHVVQRKSRDVGVLERGIVLRVLGYNGARWADLGNAPLRVFVAGMRWFDHDRDEFRASETMCLPATRVEPDRLIPIDERRPNRIRRHLAQRLGEGILMRHGEQPHLSDSDMPRVSHICQ